MHFNVFLLLHNNHIPERLHVARFDPWHLIFGYAVYIDDIEAAFAREAGDVEVELTQRTTSIKTLEWERIHETLAETNFNISETARRLGMHRRTLARKLEKQRIK